MAPTKGKAPKKKATNGYVMPDPLPNGEVVIDTSKKQWKLGPSIGTGGFGEIYSAQEVGSTAKIPKYVVKIEPHENGPLFVEMHCYMRIAKPSDVEEFRNKKNLGNIGMPVLHGSGTHTNNGKKYRFIVMPKFGTDIWKLFLENNKQFPPITVYKIGLQMLDVLEYIHSKGYIHADIKGANILLGAEKSTKEQAYLVDFGLAAKYTTNKEFKPDPKNAHNGTIEYLSRDAHKGVQTRRGDLEILGYNLIHWLGCTLPWENNLSDPKVVQASKDQNMDDIPNFLKSCFNDKPIPVAIKKFFEYINTLEFNAAPDYKKVYKILLDGLKSEGGSLESPLLFKMPETPTKRKSNGITAVPKKKQKVARTLKTAVKVSVKTPTRRGRKLKGKVMQRAESIDNENNCELDDLHEEDVADSSPKVSAKIKKMPTKRNPKSRGKALQKYKSDENLNDEDKNLHADDIEAELLHKDLVEVEKAPAKRTRTPKEISQNIDSADDGDLAETKKIPLKRGRKLKQNIDEQVDDTDENKYAGYTAEMKELQKKIEAKTQKTQKKSKKVNSNSKVVSSKQVNEDDAADVKSSTSQIDEKVNVTKRRVVRAKNSKVVSSEQVNEDDAADVKSSMSQIDEKVNVTKRRVVRAKK